MPYIVKKLRLKKGEPYYLPTNIGGLVYMLTKLCIDYKDIIAEDGFQGLNEIIGAIECTKLEFYRRVVSKHEDLKIKENGDVY